MKIYNVKEITNDKVDAKIIGNKAYNLGKLHDGGIDISEGFIIPTDLFYECVKYNNAEKYMSDLKNKNNVSQFREIIKTFIIPENISYELERKIKQIGYPVIVRSSSSNEDCVNSSMAGMYLSVSKITNIEDLKKAILDVWASAYYNYFSIKEPIAIIIQKYFEAEIGGVIFSKHPLGKDCCYGEYSMNGAEDVVEGRDNGSFEITEENILISKNTYLQSYSEELAVIVKKIKSIFQCEVDIEWLVYNRRIFILQARPITTYVRKKQIKEFCIVDVDDRETLNTIDMSGFYARYMRWFDKRDVLRKLCIKNNIQIPTVKYVFYNNKNLNMNKIYKEFQRAKIIKIESNAKVRTRRKCEVEGILREVSLGNDNSINIVRLQEITSTEYCGNACVTDEGYVYIECMPGGFGGFLSGELDFSKYLLDSTGNIIESNILKYRYMWKPNEETGRFVKSNLNNEIRGELNNTMLEKIAYMARVLNGTYKNIKIEFETEGEEVFFNDATLEKNIVSSESMLYGVVSSGDFSGIVEVISEQQIKELKEELGVRSVIAESDFINKSRRYAERMQINDGNKKILIAPYPDPCLSALSEYYEGFIFKRGGLLSHMAIILREKGKPAIIKKDTEEIENGTYLEVKNGVISIVK